MAPATGGHEAVGLLQQLIRHDTVNPPGNERAVQEFLAGVLQGAGFDVRLVGRTPGRPNLVARLPGRSDGPTLCLLSHVDTVLARPEEWSRDPWSGDLADGCVWGRGALDMKSQTAAEVSAAAALAQSGWRPAAGDLLVVTLVDEETGGAEGARWLCEHHPDLVRCDLLLNEGGGGSFAFDGERFYGVGVGEKGVFRFRLITDGVAGHASMPRIGDNALLKLGPLLQRMAERHPAPDVTEGPRALLAGLGVLSDDDDAQRALERLHASSPGLAVIVEPMLGVTLAPTRARASDKINVIPSVAEVGVDCRVPPGLGEDVALRRVHEVLGGEGYRVEFSETVVGNASAVDTPLMETIGRWVDEHDPGARCVPTILPGFTDSRTFREAFPDLVAYGFFPMRHTPMEDWMPLVHGADERIDVRDLEFATGFFRDVTLEVLGG